MRTPSISPRSSWPRRAHNLNLPSISPRSSWPRRAHNLNLMRSPMIQLRACNSPHGLAPSRAPPPPGPLPACMHAPGTARRAAGTPRPVTRPRGRPRPHLPPRASRRRLGRCRCLPSPSSCRLSRRPRAAAPAVEVAVVAVVAAAVVAVVASRGAAAPLPPRAAASRAPSRAPCSRLGLRRAPSRARPRGAAASLLLCLDVWGRGGLGRLPGGRPPGCRHSSRISFRRGLLGRIGDAVVGADRARYAAAPKR